MTSCGQFLLVLLTYTKIKASHFNEKRESLISHRYFKANCLNVLNFHFLYESCYQLAIFQWKANLFGLAYPRLFQVVRIPDATTFWVEHVILTWLGSVGNHLSTTAGWNTEQAVHMTTRKRGISNTFSFRILASSIENLYCFQNWLLYRTHQLRTSWASFNFIYNMCQR
jgi:hypothetical protein